MMSHPDVCIHIGLLTLSGRFYSCAKWCFLLLIANSNWTCLGTCRPLRTSKPRTWVLRRFSPSPRPPSRYLINIRSNTYSSMLLQNDLCVNSFLKKHILSFGGHQIVKRKKKKKKSRIFVLFRTELMLTWKIIEHLKLLHEVAFEQTCTFLKFVQYLTTTWLSWNYVDFFFFFDKRVQSFARSSFKRLFYVLSFVIHLSCYCPPPPPVCWSDLCISLSCWTRTLMLFSCWTFLPKSTAIRIA